MVMFLVPIAVNMEISPMHDVAVPLVVSVSYSFFKKYMI